MSVLGIIFLSHATSRYEEALHQIEVAQATGWMIIEVIVFHDCSFQFVR